ncbi:MAG: [acyl-carrier-protein] S-malonyltransferase [Maribacter sp.]|jgi:[acyl-carrier-protein] S-malonyltransferase
MKKAYVFPGQGSQFEGMGKDLYESSPIAKSYFDKADEILGYSITKVMFEGTAEELKETRITQPAVFLYSVIKVLMLGEEFQPDMVAGHSLGEISALVANKTLTFEAGLKLVQQRAEAMQKACELEESSMAAIVGLDDEAIEKICEGIDDIVVAANYNCPGQLVISGSVSGVTTACEQLKEAGAKRALMLPVRGAFHSPLMKPAEDELREAIEQTTFNTPVCPVYQNVTAQPESDPETIQKNLVAQLTSPVRWTQTMHNMIADGVEIFIESGGKVLRGFVKRVDRKFPTETL